MKQHITLKQLNELNEKGKERWLTYLESKETDYDIGVGSSDLLVIAYSTIGQMVEFLDESDKLFEFYYFDLFIVEDYGEDGKEWLKPKKWCDALWKECKEILND